MNLSIFSTKDYENKSNWTLGENKPNSNPIKPNFRNAKLNVNLTLTKDYRKKDDFAVQKNKPNSNPISEKPKMNANVFIAKDYENETAFEPQKNKPKQTQSVVFSKLVPAKAGIVRFRMQPKLLNFHLKIRRPNQLFAASARANVTAQPAAIIIIRAKMMYLTLTSLKKRSIKRKYTPKTAVTKAKNAITTSTQHNKTQAGWILNASKILPWAKASVAVVIPHVGQGSPYLCLNPQYPSHSPILIS